MKSSEKLIARTTQIRKHLARLYPQAKCPLRHENAFQLLVATILSAQCTDERVNLTTPELFRQFPTPQSMACADKEQLVQAIRSVSFPGNKAGYLKQMSQRLVSDFGGEVPSTIEQLTQLPGVGRKTANVVLGVWFDIPGLTPDTHFQRVTRRLGLTQHTDPDKIEQDLMKLVPQNEWTLFSHWVISHGRQICHARKPQCGACVLKELCSYYQTLSEQDKQAVINRP